MRYRQSIVINKPRAKVIELFGDQSKLKQWQAGLQKVTPLSGEAGEEGAKTKLYYQRDDQELEIIQTITKKSIPQEFHATYETNGLVNDQENYFNTVGDNFTEWQTISTFKFKGVKKVIFNLMKSAFKEESLKYMIAFKKYVESV
jgi:hypothetical protein